METKVQFSEICLPDLLESYTKPGSNGRKLSEVSALIGDSCKDYRFFQVIDHPMSSDDLEKMFKLEVENQSVLLATGTSIASGSPFCEFEVYTVIDHGTSLEELQKTFKLEVENQSTLWAMGTRLVPASYYCSIATGSPLCEFDAYAVRIHLAPASYYCSIATGLPLREFEAYAVRIHFLNIGVDSLIVLDLNGGFSNKGFKSAPIDFYPKGEHTVFQKTKYMKCSKGGRAENIRPSHIRRLRRRRNRDDEEDGEDNQRPSDSNSLSLILLIILLLMLLLIVLSLILWLTS